MCMCLTSHSRENYKIIIHRQAETVNISQIHSEHTLSTDRQTMRQQHLPHYYTCQRWHTFFKCNKEVYFSLYFFTQYVIAASTQELSTSVRDGTLCFQV